MKRDGGGGGGGGGNEDTLGINGPIIKSFYN